MTKYFNEGQLEHMVNKFLHKYEDKSQEELESIINARHNYQPSAVEAAARLLNEKFKINVEGLSFRADKFQGNLQAKPKQNRTFDWYIRTFSKREIISAISCSFLFVALLKLFIYYKSEDWIDENIAIIMFFVFVFINVLNHIFYKKEHKRRNLVWGRIAQVGLTTAFTAFVVFLSRIILENNQIYYWDLGRALGMFAFLILLVFSTEILISIIRRLLLIFKWRIW